MFEAIKRRYTARAPAWVLPGYRRQPHPWKLRARNWAAIASIIVFCLIYGLFIAVLPIQLYIYLAVPIIILAALVIWALPDTQSVPEKAIERFFFTFLVALFLWPNYLALALPGLPWITINRLVTFPMAILFVISLAVSSQMRAELSATLRANFWVTFFLCAYIFAMSYTLPLGDVREGLNRYIDAWSQWFTIFFIAAWLFTKPGRPERFMRLLLICAVIMVIVALVEWHLEHPPWRDIVPKFLLPPDDNVQRILQGQRRAAVGVYRLQGTFSTSLNLAEFLAFAYSAVFFWFIASQSFWTRMWLIVYVPLAFFIIILTDSRAGPVGTVATLFISMLFWTVRRWRNKRDDPIAPALLTLFPVLLAVFVALSLTWNRLKVMTWGGGQHAPSNQTREVQWAKFWPAIGSWPLGYGISDGPEKAGTVNGNGVFTLDSHYILTFLDFGLIGGIGLYGMHIAAAVKALRHGTRSLGHDQSLLLATGVLITVSLITMLVIVQDDSHALLFMGLGLICALLSPVREQTLARERLARSTERSAWSSEHPVPELRA